MEVGKYNVDQELVKEIIAKYSMFGDYTLIILNELKKVGLYEGKVSKSKIQEIPLVTTAIMGEIYYKIF